VRELFFYFLCKGTAVTKEQVASALWPGENDPQAIKQRFKAYIFRLRRATRRDIVVFDDEYYGFNFALDYEYDVEAFETFLARARSTREPAEKIDNYLKAVELAQKPYLAEVNLPWVLGERERLDQVLLGALMELAELQLSTQKLNEACATAQHAIRVDPYREEAYRLLMKIHSASLDRPAIHKQYQACKSALAEIGLSPSLETQQLYQKLVK
jgi:two-component SAPR family response regulator